MSDIRCPECRKPVETYHPANDPQPRAVRHPESAYIVGGYQCPGSFQPAEAQR
jgi:hypothetical protein